MSTAYVWQSETATCTRCGLARQIHPGRDIADICVDCRTVERDAARAVSEAFTGILERGPGGVYRKREPMSSVDMAWCEKQAGAAFWSTWRRQARTADHPPLQAEAIRRAQRLCTAASELCTPPVQSGLPNSEERMFDSNEPIEGVG